MICANGSFVKNPPANGEEEVADVDCAGEEDELLEEERFASKEIGSGEASPAEGI